MTDRITARIANNDKRKALKHGWLEQPNPLELPINPIEEKEIETERTIVDVFKNYFTKGE